jgi:hypothetical protein
MQRAQRRKFHFIYKTVCIITNKFYIGMHSTDNLEDGYIGSGKRLWHSINKHGKENHVCQILEFLESRDDLKAREREIVNVELIGEELCMNLRIGGDGGFSSKNHQLITSSAGGKANSEKIKNNPEHKAKFAEFANKMRAKSIKNGTFKVPSWEGKSHTESTKSKIGEANSIKQKGENNSQYGKCWITNEIESKKIYKGDTIPEGWRLGRKM